MLTEGMIQAFDLIPGSVVVADDQYTIRYVNPQGLMASGYQLKEIVGCSITEFWEQPAEVSREILSHLERHRSWQGEIKHKRKEGPGYLQTVSLSIAPAACAGKTALVQVSLPPLPDRQKASQKLEERYQKLAQEAERYKIILDASPDPICLTRVDDGKYVYVNETFYERTGFTPEQIVKYTSIELNVYADQKERKRLISQLERDGRVENLEVTMRRKDGKIVSDLWSLRIIEYEGAPHLLLISRNYSQLRAAQQALRESEESYRSILEAAPYSIVVTRLTDSCYMQVNESFCRRTGFSRDQVIGHTPYELGLPADKGFRKSLFEVLDKKGRVDGMYVRFKAKNGTILENLLSTIPIKYKGEDCLLTITVDINEQKAAERALRQSEERYRNILRNMEEGYWETDFKGTYTFVNESECRIHRRTKGQLIGARAREVSSPESYEKIAGIINEVYKTGTPAPLYEIEIIRGDGTIAVVEASASLLKDIKGEPAGFFGISRDITEKRKAEKELENYRRHLEKMVQERTRALEKAQGELVKREKLAVLGQLTATVSHELRNPLGVIRFSNFYLQRNIETRSEKITKHFTRIDEQVGHCDRIVADLLEYTHGKPISVKTELLLPWLKELVDQIQETHSIAITRHFPDEMLPIAHDREKMRRVFINLIENAIQAIKDWNAPNNKIPSDYEPKVSVTVRNEKERLVITVTDNGVGMDIAISEKAFEPLFTTRARGTGIGLANVHRIVTDHGGRVSLESKPGHGTTATVILPYSPKDM